MVTYPCPIKFLHFCDVCDIPVILFLYDVKNEIAYWTWVQRYLYTTLDIDNPNWRKNKDSVVVKMSTEECTVNKELFFSELKDIASNGIHHIAQMRKSKTYKQYYTVINESDISNGLARRVTARILIETSFASSKEAMKAIIPFINGDFRFSDYIRSSQVKELFGDRPADFVALFFYDDIKQVEHGLPFCRTQWISENLLVKPSILTPDETLEGIGIKWEDSYKMFSTYIPENQLTKGQYFELAEQTYSKVKTLYNKLNSLYELYKNAKISFGDFVSAIEDVKPTLDRMYFTFSDRGYPPIECTDMDRVLLDIVSALHDIGIVTINSDREESNISWLINDSLSRSSKQMPFYEYERNKVR